MKRILFLFSILIALLSFGCQQQGSTGQETVEAKVVSLEAWDAVKEEYHHLMAFTFHPAEDGDLDPIKNDHAKIVDKAKEFAGLAIPAELEGKGLEQLIPKLQTESEALSTLIAKGGSDEEIKTALFALHDVYHSIEEASMH